MAYDVKVWELALHFLPGDVAECKKFAQGIQDYIEAYLTQKQEAPESPSQRISRLNAERRTFP